MMATNAIRLTRATALRSGALCESMMTRRSSVAAAARCHVALGNAIIRNQSSVTVETPVKSFGFVEKPLRALDMAAVNRINQELQKVDANSDGRYVNPVAFDLVYMARTVRTLRL